jgi:hypothetical protein
MNNLKTNLNRVEKGYILDIETIIKDISLNYIITTHEGKNVLFSDLMNKYYPKKQEKICQCSAILNNGNRCSHKSLQDTNYLYCKKHFFKFNKHKNLNKIDEFNDISIEENIHDENEFNIDDDDTIDDTIDYNNNDNYIDITLLNKHFIDDKLYYYDNKFIYTMNNKNVKKCGYVELNNTEKEMYKFILIDDPFLLQQL